MHVSLGKKLQSDYAAMTGVNHAWPTKYPTGILIRTLYKEHSKVPRNTEWYSACNEMQNLSNSVNLNIDRSYQVLKNILQQKAFSELEAIYSKYPFTIWRRNTSKIIVYGKVHNKTDKPNQSQMSSYVWQTANT